MAPAWLDDRITAAHQRQRDNPNSVDLQREVQRLVHQRSALQKDRRRANQPAQAPAAQALDELTLAHR